MRRILVALFGLLICGSAFACTVEYHLPDKVVQDGEDYDVEILGVKYKHQTEVRHYGKGPCYGGDGKSGGFEKPKPTESDIRFQYAEIQRIKKMGKSTDIQERRLLEMLSR